jgi:cell division septation protein DedD
MDDALAEPVATVAEIAPAEPVPVVADTAPIEVAPIDPTPVEPPPVASGAVAEFASEAVRPMRRGASFPARTSWRERIGRRPHPIAMLVLTGIVLCAATIAASSWYRVEPGAPVAREASLPNTPSPPHLLKAAPFAITASEAKAVTTPQTVPPVAAGKYIIQVASFEDERRAAQLVAELAGRGYRVYKASFDLDGEPWWQVSIGPYQTFADAEADLEKVREIPGYDDATLRNIGRP